MKKYNGTTRYDDNAGYGVLPSGTRVQFPDGTNGGVVQGYTNEKSLVTFPAGNGTVNQDVYDNKILFVEE
ncbi:MAG TPA: hypothetical protein VLA24_09335 [Pseudomonadales bacterium]|nr:hypothetical protein [Pseudomonadales bacterium]